MLGRDVTVTYDQNLRPQHVYVEPRFHAEFNEAMREVGILVELVEPGGHRHCFQVIDPSQSHAVEAALSHWKEMGYWRYRPR